MAQSRLLDVCESFKEGPSVEVREGLAVEICELYNTETLEPGEKVIVKEILGHLSRDIEKSIRKILSETLKENKDLPHGVAVRLINDLEEISIPVLQYSPVLTDDDLEAIISDHPEDVKKLLAIATREEITAKISSCLVNTESEIIVHTLVQNKSAEISETTFNKVLRLFGHSENMLTVLVSRGDLSPNVAERMISMVSTKLQNQLVQQYGVTKHIVKPVVKASREKMTLDIIAGNADRTTTAKLVEHLFETGKLSHSLVLRALCRADLTFFEYSIARLADIPIANVQKLIYQGDSRSFTALFRAASLPVTMLEATEILLKLVLQNEKAKDEDTTMYSRRLVEHIVDAGYDVSVPNMQYFLALIGRSVVDTKTTLH